MGGGAGALRAWRADLWTIAVVSSMGTVACTGGESPPEQGFVRSAEATLLWQQADDAPVRAYVPRDLDPESGSVVWVADAALTGIIRFEPTAGDSRIMGALDKPPEAIRNPVRVAVAREFGVFVYDQEFRQVQQYSLDGEPIRTFEPGFVPSRIEISRRPIGLVLAAAEPGADSVPHLKVIRTDLRGLEPDTLLFPGSHGPPGLWDAAALSGEVSVDAGEGGLWVRARVVPDTVFELAAGGGRTRSLRAEDRDAAGILTDVPRGILWVASAPVDAESGMRLAAYEIETPGALPAAAAFLGERTLPVGFKPRAAIDGVVIGWLPGGGKSDNLAALDMVVPAAGR